MFNVSLYIARRLSLSRDGKRRSPAIWVAVVGVALSIAVMLLSVSIVLGFKQNIRNKVMGFNAHVTLRPSVEEDGDATSMHINLTDQLRKTLDDAPLVKHWQPVTAVPAIMKTNTQFKGLYLKGVDNRYDFSFLQKDLVSGKIPDFSQAASDTLIVISQRVASQLGLKTGDRINVYFVDPGIRVRPMHVAAIFDTHFEDYDNMFVYGSISTVNELCGLESDQSRSLEINTTEPDYDNLRSITETIQTYMLTTNDDQPTLEIHNVYEAGASYFNWLALLDTNVVVILSLMVLLSCFTLISCMLILILERVKTIGLLKALGASHSQVRRIFVWMARRIALRGILIGNLLALLFIFAQQQWHLIPLDADSYYIDYVPVQFNLWWLLAVNIGAVGLIWLSLILPSHMVSRISPATTLRTE